MNNQYTYVKHRGNKIYTKQRTATGEVLYNRVSDFEPEIFVQTKVKQPHTNMFGGSVKKLPCDSIQDFKRIKESYKDIKHMLYGMHNLSFQYIYHTFPNAIENFDFEKIRVAYNDIEVVAKELQPDGTYIPTKFPDPREAAHEINLICHYDSFLKKYFVFALNHNTKSEWKERFKHGELDGCHIQFMKYNSEQEMLRKFMKFFCDNCPDIFTGWNFKNFDVQYIMNRCKILMGEDSIKGFSPFGIVTSYEKNDDFGNPITEYDIYGCSIIDYKDAYSKYIFDPRENMKLDYIVGVELQKHKLKLKGNFLNMLQNEFQLFTDYNCVDVLRVKELDDKLGLMKLIVFLSYYAGINYNDTFSPVKTWDTMIYRELRNHDIIIPFDNPQKEKDRYLGAFVMEPKPKKRKWVAAFDYESLYPCDMMQTNNSPETLLSPDAQKFHMERLKSVSPNVANCHTQEDFIRMLSQVDFEDEHLTNYLVDNKLCLAGNGQLFDVSKDGFLRNMIKDLFTQRKANKKLSGKYKKEAQAIKSDQTRKGEYDSLIHDSGVYGIIQMAQKILLNSLYGACGTNSFRYYSLQAASSVTYTGQSVIIRTGLTIEKFIHTKLLGKSPETCAKKIEDCVYLVYGDTDSVYLELDELVTKFMPHETDKQKICDWLDKVCKIIEKECIKPMCDQYLRNTNGIAQHMNADREVIAQSAIWKGKKMYACSVLDNEGYRYDTPNIKIMGLSAKKATTQQRWRTHLTEMIRIILEEDEPTLHAYFSTVKDEYMKASPNEIAINKGVNSIKQYENEKTIYYNPKPKGGVPMQSRAAVLYNHYIQEYKCDDVHQEIHEGDKIKIIKLTKPNPIGENVIAFSEELPEEFGLTRYVDYETNFRDDIENPIKEIAGIAKWNLVRTRSLLDFLDDD